METGDYRCLLLRVVMDPHKRTSLSKRDPEGRVYRELDQARATVLYTVLKLQDQQSGATQEAICKMTRFGAPHVSRLLGELRDAGYVIESQIYTNTKARKIYEVDALNSITFRDSAIIILEMLDYQCNDPEGKIETESFVTHLVKCGKLRDFNSTDLLGNEKHRGKIDLLADNGQHIERITPRFIKPRIKARLQRLYLELIAEEVPLEKLQDKTSPERHVRRHSDSFSD
jgi:hypothetical protein